jgi:hypothetical protein
MPFSEDSREGSLIFPSLAKPESALLAAIDDYIDRKILNDDQLVTDEIPNPSLDRFWKTVEARANGNGDEPVAPIDEEIWNQLNPKMNDVLIGKASRQISQLAGLKAVSSEDDPEAKKRKKYWREIRDREQLVPEPSGSIDVKRIRIESTQETEFENGENFVSRIYSSLTGNDVSGATELISQFHLHAFESRNVKPYNEFMRKLGESASSNPRIWREVLRRDIPMQITKDELPESNISKVDGLEFISSIIKKI